MSKILLVSDDPSLCEEIHEALAGESYAIRYVLDGRRGIAMLVEEPTDLIIADWTTTAREEVESLKQLRLECHDVKRLVITESGTPEVVIDALRGHVCDFLTKPAVPFGGIYRIIDFTLSNCVNSGLRRLYILTQYKQQSLSRHIRQGWHLMQRDLDEFIEILPPQQRIGEEWYRGTADAVYQNLFTFEQERFDYALILSGDHIYKMNYELMLDFHRAKMADATVAVIEVAREQAHQFGGSHRALSLA